MTFYLYRSRFQPIVPNYLKKKFKIHSLFSIAGSGIGVTASRFKKWHQTFWDNLDTSIKLHGIKKLIVINHQDCGAAKILNGKKKFDKFNETQIHKASFKKIKKSLKKKHPKLKIETILISLNKRFKNFYLSGFVD